MQEAIFHSEKYFLGLVQRALSGNAPVQICSDALGEVVVDPVRRRYAAYVDNLAVFCCMPTETFRIQQTNEQFAKHLGNDRDIDELLWAAAYHASAGRLPPDTSKFDVLRLNYWPNLSRLPASPDVIRLCALFSRRSHTLNLARKLLGVGEEDAHRFYCAAIASGALQRLSTPTTIGREEPEPEPMTLGKTLSHLWHRLVGG